ncbi:MAG: cell division protein FtsL [bacterium]|nr:cell division protein FtsL [bacterium]
MRSKFFLYFIFIILFASSIFANVWQDIRITSYGYKIGILEEEKRNLQKEKKYYKLKTANLKSPKRIKKIASEKLGLIIPKKLEIITLTINNF